LTQKIDVAVMHDFFVDRLVHTASIDRLTWMVTEKAGAGGGGLHGITQEEIRGGNAVNLAHALARLGLSTLLITHSERTHLPLLRHTFEGLPTELRVKRMAAGLTVALEGKVNVMLGDSGGAADFGPARLDERDWEALESSRVVCSVNWAANRRGTELLVALRRRLGKKKTIFFDPADFRDRLPQYKDLLKQIADRGLVDWVSMNEVEGLATARVLGIETDGLGEISRGIAKKLGVDFDLHAAGKSYHSDGSTVQSVAVEKTNSRRLTGAGDVWDAASIFGRLKEMKNLDRLKFANRAARLYLEGTEPIAPSLGQMGSTG
jgi:sugar/nucleoside kinase (ribokinase family)